MENINLSFLKLKDGTCNIFADIFLNKKNACILTAEQAKFVQVGLYKQTDSKHTLLNIPYEALREFAKDVLNI